VIGASDALDVVSVLVDATLGVDSDGWALEAAVFDSARLHAMVANVSDAIAKRIANERMGS
jgi:hypothetical protein